MYSRDIKVTVSVGLHARPATYFVQKASEFNSSIWMDYDGRRVNAKSLLGILSLGVEQESLITIIAEGKDEETAVNKLVNLIQSDFKEE
jgi:phosphocarrier protein